MAIELQRSERGRGLRELGPELAALWRRQPRARQLGGAALVLAVIAAVAYSTWRATDQGWVVVTRSPQGEDAHARAAMLQRAGLTARVRGREVLVATGDIPRAVELLGRAEPEAAPAARSGLWSGPCDAQAPLREQELRLEQGLRMLAPVSRAQVHLAPARRSVFKSIERAPGAAVVLHLHQGHELTPQLDGNVRRLVASAVTGLEESAVTVLDQHGAAARPPLAGSEERVAVESEIGAKVRAVLEPLLGRDKVRVVANAELTPRGGERAAPQVQQLRVAVLVDTRALGEDQRADSAKERWRELAQSAAGVRPERGDTLTLQEAALEVPPPSAPAATPRPEVSGRPSPTADSSSAAAPTSPSASTSTPAPPAPTSTPALAQTSGPSATPTGVRWYAGVDWRWLASGLAALTLVFALVVVRGRRPRRRHAPTPAPAPEAVPTAPAPSALELELARASQTLSADLDATALVLAAWLAQGRATDDVTSLEQGSQS